AAMTGLAIAAEDLLELDEQVGIGTEMTEIVIATLDRIRHPLLHFGAVVAMEAVAFHESGAHVLAAEDLLERLTDRCRPGARGAGHRNDRVSGRHDSSPTRGSS